MNEWLHQYWHACLMFDHQIEHHLVEGRAVIAAIATGHLEDVFCGVCVTIVAAVDVEAGAIEMQEGGRQASALGRRGSNEAVEL